MTDPDAFLSTEDAAAALTASGFPVRPSTLKTLRCRGGGPRFYRFGTRITYQWRDLRTWAEARRSPPLGSTSEAAARRPALAAAEPLFAEG